MLILYIIAVLLPVEYSLPRLIENIIKLSIMKLNNYEG